MASRIEIDLLGTHFILTSDHKSDYLQLIFSQYKKCIQKVQDEVNVKDPLKIAIIAGIVASEMSINHYQSFKNNDIVNKKGNKVAPLSQEDAQAIDFIAKNLLKKISDCIEEK